jgi:hypothetical protein
MTTTEAIARPAVPQSAAVERVPGIADINVQVVGAVPDQLTAVVKLFNANAGAPPPDVAKLASGGGGWYRAPLWIMAPGSNSVTVAVKGPQGTGSVVVPVTAVAHRRLPLERSLGSVLAGIGVFLFAGLVTIAGAAVRESVLPPGEMPSRRRIWGARGAMAGSAAFVGLALFGRKVWWDAEDAAFREQMDRPFTTVASIAGAGASRTFRLDITDSLWIRRVLVRAQEGQCRCESTGRFFWGTECAGQARGETSARELGRQDLHLFNGSGASQ